MHALILPHENTIASASFRSDGEVLHVSINEESDSFDFTGKPDGEAFSFESELPFNPLVKAVKKDGELMVTLIGWYGDPPSQENGENNADFQRRLDEYEIMKTEREVEI